MNERADVGVSGGAGTVGGWPIECRACRRVLAWRLADGTLVPVVAGAMVERRKMALPCPCGRLVRVRR